MGCTTSITESETVHNTHKSNKQHFQQQLQINASAIPIRSSKRQTDVQTQKEEYYIAQPKNEEQICKQSIKQKLSNPCDNNLLKNMSFSSIQSRINTQTVVESQMLTLQNILFKKQSEQPINFLDRRYNHKQPFNYPYNCIGMLMLTKYDKERKKYKESQNYTGFLISKNIILTSAHCLMNYNEDPNYILHFKFLIRQFQNQTLSSIFYRAVDVTSIKFPNKPLEPDPENLASNYCLLQLQRQIIRDKYLILGYNYSQLSGAEIFGYPSDKFLSQSMQKQNLFGMKGKIIDINQKHIEYDIDTSSGQSGSPIIINPIDGYYFVVGIHSGYIQKLTIFEDNINILDKLQISSAILNRQHKVNIGTHLTSSTIKQIKQMWQELKLTNNIEIVDLQNFLTQFDGQQFIFDIKPDTKISKQLSKKIAIDNQIALQQKNQQLYKLKHLQNHKSKYQNIYFKYCQTLCYCQQYHKSLAFCEHSNQLIKKQTNLMSYQANLMAGINYQQLDQFQLALSAYRKCQQNISKKSLKENILQQILLLNNISTIYLQTNKYHKARNFLNKIYQLIKEHSLFSYNVYCGFLINRAILCRQEHNIRQALYFLELALEFHNSSEHQHGLWRKRRKITILQNKADCLLIKNQYGQWAQTGFDCIMVAHQAQFQDRLFQLKWFSSFLINLVKFKQFFSHKIEFDIAKKIEVLFGTKTDKKMLQLKKDFLKNLKYFNTITINQFSQ